MLRKSRGSLKKIIHIDLDYFFAQVELLTRPELKDKPVAIAYDGKRSVLSTCNYVAREHGLHSAMALSTAKKKCPDVVIISPNFSKYKEKSEKFFEILKNYSKQIEKVSIDEAYIDITECNLFNNDGNKIARAMKKEVYEKLNLTASIGLSYNKFLAKIGSELFKPDGYAILRPDEIEKKITHFPVSRINGVGKVLKKKLESFGLSTFGDLQEKSKLELSMICGSFGETLFSYSRGIDHRVVQGRTGRKSLSLERTFGEDRELNDELVEYFKSVYFQVEDKLKNYETPIKSIFVKIKFDNFEVRLKERKDLELNFENFLELLYEIKIERKIRLIGLGVRFYSKSEKGQLSLI